MGAAMDRGRLLLQGLDERGPGGYTYGRQLSHLSFWLFLAFLASLLAYFSWDVPVARSVAFLVRPIEVSASACAASRSGGGGRAA